MIMLYKGNLILMG